MPEDCPVAATIAEVREAVADARSRRLTVALVPTMGALHAGHAELARRACEVADFVVVSVFVNPTQFGPNEDYTRYPRTLDDDRRIVAEAGGDLVFAPSVEEIYPAGSRTYVEVPGLDGVLCGPSRPGHFRGVCTIVMKLFQIVLPDVAVFGQKDAQQALIVRKMVADLNVPVRMIVAPTVREPDGLAMSSRNRYLTPQERAVAPGIHSALSKIEKLYGSGQICAESLANELRADLRLIPGSRLDYAEILSADDLTPLEKIDREALVAVALYLGNTRLIDNTILR